MKNKDFKWLNRYSDTMDADKFGRWMRIFYFKDLKFAHIKQTTYNFKTFYNISINFPINNTEIDSNNLGASEFQDVVSLSSITNTLNDTLNKYKQ